MAMTNTRPLASSASFSALASTSSLASPSPSRPLKRRLFSAPDLNFFKPAEDTFKPLPYTPNHSAPARDAHPERPPIRPVVNHAHSTQNLDPLPSDPDAVFIRYPFTTFPDQDKYPEGLSYTALAENQNWFLDPDDYIHENNTNPGAAPYPAVLEPPRGWCPAKKKDLKDKGSEGWPEGEQPRLRCTFCRRTYAGVNAKSMWRRHVFEKHKIAMSNRRTDVVERPRGRTSNKENKRASGKAGTKKDGSHETILNLDDDATVPVVPLTPKGGSAPPLDRPVPTSPTRVVPPASPYDPSLTPSFRHSPPRPISAWRFASPGHPLHRSRNLPLSMLLRDSPISSSPIVPKRRPRAATTPFSSPCTSTPSFGTPESLSKLPPFPRALTFSPGVQLAASTPPSSADRRARTMSDVPDGWTLSDPIPFVAPLYQDNDDGTPPLSSSEGGSPAVGSGAESTVAGLGVGLLEPFVLPADSSTDMDIDELIHLDDGDEEDEVLEVLMSSQASMRVEDPPLKRRRTAT